MTGQKSYFIETFGCQMNVNDSEKVAGLLDADGYRSVDSVEQANIVFINTCAVREKASDKLFHALGRLKAVKRARPDLVVSVGGCVAQLEGKSILERAPHVDVLVGTHNFGRLPELLRDGTGGPPRVDLDRSADSLELSPHTVAHSNPVRAYVTVMEGCNHVCSFCVVPRTRGPEVNRRPADIEAEVQVLTERGVPEVMLLGQTVNAYRFGATGFTNLLERVHDVARLRRLRFTTSHPEHVTSDLARAFARLPKLCDYLHLPVQSGSDRILESMRRGYTAAQYRDTIALLRDHAPQLALSSDVIVGYPGESDADFEASLELIQEIGFDGLFVFAYSTRPGTTAARMPDDVPDLEKKRRVHVLNQLQQKLQAARNARRVGGRAEVLVESIEEGRAVGRTRDFKVAHVDGVARVGDLIDVVVTRSGPNSLGARLADTRSLTVSSSVPIL